MFPVVHLGEVQEFLHIVTDIFPLFPYHSDLYADGWTEGNSFYAGRGKDYSAAGAGVSAGAGISVAGADSAGAVASVCGAAVPAGKLYGLVCCSF